MVEAGGRCEVSRPDLGGIADSHRPACRRIVAGGSRIRVEPREVSRQPLGQARRDPSQALADRRRRLRRHQEFRRGQEHRAVDRADRPLVGRVERADRVDLVAEEFEPDRQRQRWREDVDDAAAPRELAATRDFSDRLVAEIEQLGEEGDLRGSGRRGGAGAVTAGRSAGEMVCCRRAWTLATRMRARPLCHAGEGRHACCRLVGDQLAALVGEGRPGLEDRDRLRVAEPGAELFGDAIADLRIASDPDQPFALAGQREGRGEIRLRTVRDRDEADVPAGPARFVLGASETFAQ